MRYASAASILRDDHSRSSAAPRPTWRGSSHVEPCSATRPRLENTTVNAAWVDAKRRSLIAASTNPPPAVTPLTAAMIGLGCCVK